MMALVWSVVALLIGVVAGSAEANARPMAPTNLTGSSTANGVVLTWTAPDDDTVVGYRVLKRELKSEDTELSVIVSNTGNLDTTWTDATVQDKDRYVYRVRSVSATAVSVRSRALRIRYVGTDVPRVPGKPEELWASNGDSGIVLTWKAPTGDVSGYRVWRRSPGDGQRDLDVYHENAAATAKSWTDENVAIGKKYVYRVQAENDGGAGKRSHSAVVVRR